MTAAETRPLPLLRVAFAFYLVLALAGVVWLGLRRGAIGLDLFVDRGRWPLDLLLGIAVGGGLAVSWGMARRWLRQITVIEERLMEALGPLDTSEALSLAILSAIAEEFFFRGAVQDAWGYPTAAVLFTLLHLGPGREFRLWTLFAAVAGLALGGLVAWRGTLLAAVVAHALVNAVGLVRLARGVAARAGGER